MTIVVEGTDGSGKSYIIEHISPQLKNHFVDGIVYSHLRPHYLPDIAEIFGRRKKREEGGGHVEVTDPHAGKPSGIITSLFRWSYYMIDYTYGYYKKIWLPYKTKNSIIIFDRYYYDYYIDPIRSKTSLPQWMLEVGEWFIPKPDLILCLGGNPEIIYSRKPETSLQEVTRQTNKLKDFCSKKKNAVWIDTTLDPAETIDTALKSILQK